MRKPAHCCVCDTALHEVLSVDAAGYPIEVGGPLAPYRRSWVVLRDGAVTFLSHCTDCSPENDWPAAWLGVMELNVFDHARAKLDPGQRAAQFSELATLAANVPLGVLFHEMVEPGSV